MVAPTAMFLARSQAETSCQSQRNTCLPARNEKHYLSKKTAATAGRCCLCLANQSAWKDKESHQLHNLIQMATCHTV